MSTIVVHPLEGRPLVGSVPVPRDKSIGHRALLFAALCEGTSEIRGFSHGEDNVSTANALRAMGVVVEERRNAKGQLEPFVRVTGRGLFGLRRGFRLRTFLVAPPIGDLAHADIEERHEEDAERGGCDHAAHHADADGALRPRSRACGNGKRQHAEDKGEGGHQDRAQTHACGMKRGFH